MTSLPLQSSNNHRAAAGNGRELDQIGRVSMARAESETQPNGATTTPNADSKSDANNMSLVQ